MTEFKTDNYCFACGKENPIGLRMEVQIIQDGARANVTLSREYQGLPGIIHGGIVTTLLDEIMAHAVLNHVGGAVTTALSVSLRQALRVGEEVEAVGTVVEKNRRAARARAEIVSCVTGKVIARGESQFILLNGSSK